MTQQEQKEFDFHSGQALKKTGMEMAAEKRSDVLDVARHIALRLARRNKDQECTADEVQRVMVQSGYTPSDLGNAAGSIFKEKKWKWTGRCVPSTRTSRRGNPIRVWRLSE